MISKTTFGITAGVLGSLFVGYCLYFDRKRRSDPLFRQKLKEKRKAEKEKEKRKTTPASDVELPNLNDPEAVQKFFLEQVQTGEELLAQGLFEQGVEHLSNAVAVCAQPTQLLQLLQQTLPPQVFGMLMKKIGETSQRIAKMSSSSSGGKTAAPSGFKAPEATIEEEDDLE
ncbi:putative mitochondrial import receptor subunit TOM20-like isoform X1 [Apostichopus japonicus]|uniref:Putative mitochondrial import receptor subunit TOM20-like isoform X1 n=1 Tax=Stichopus japonicus TaxID=307972 RepID=A0A2G8LMR6_STIJA|nr:putative mitochondrial import receptor subunit TOM20-like isoform X1 [Apostichopus japonicus]